MQNISTDINMRETDMKDISILIEGCKSLGITLSDSQKLQFVRYYQMLYEKNKVMNLTAVIGWDEVQTKHYLDSLLLCKVADLRENCFSWSGYHIGRLSQ